MHVEPSLLAASLQRHLRDEILPFWQKHGIDHERGGYHTLLGRDGRPVPGPKSLVLQARTMDAFVAGARLTGDREYLVLARHGFEFLATVMYSSDDGRWAGAVDEQGAALGERIHAFGLTAVIHALANYSGATGDLDAMELAFEAFDGLEMLLKDRGNGGYFDCLDAEYQVCERTKSLDVHLHAVEAFYALADASPKGRNEIPAREILDLLMARSTERDAGPSLERFTEDWSAIDSDAGPQVRYGHLSKEAWLFLEGFRRFGRDEYASFARMQLDHVVNYGVDGRAGVYEAGTPEGEATDTRHSWWAQCETIAALARAWTVWPDADWQRLLGRLVGHCFARFHDPQYGEWYAMLAPDNAVSDPRKGTDRKSPYPVVRAFMTAANDLQRLGAVEAIPAKRG